MSFQFKVFWGGGGQTWGAGTGVLFKKELEEFLVGRSQVFNTMKLCLKNKSLKILCCSAGWQGLRNPLHGMKGLNRAGLLFMPVKPPESLSF